MQSYPDIRIVDFACSCGQRGFGPRGKSPYQAPEAGLHQSLALTMTAELARALSTVVSNFAAPCCFTWFTSHGACHDFQMHRADGYCAFGADRFALGLDPSQGKAGMKNS